MNVFHLFFFSILERERERIEEKKQRIASEKKTTKSQSEKIPSEESTTAASAPAAVGTAVEPAKELKIEVHATAVHHEKLEPIVAHAQSHEISHNQAVNQLKSVSLPCILNVTQVGREPSRHTQCAERILDEI